MHFIVSPSVCVCLLVGTVRCLLFSTGMGWVGGPQPSPAPSCVSGCMCSASSWAEHTSSDHAPPHGGPTGLWQHREDPKDPQHPRASPAASGGAPAGSAPPAATGACPENCFGNPARLCSPAASLRYPLPPSSGPGEADVPLPPGIGPPSGIPPGYALCAPSLSPVGVGCAQTGWLSFTVAIQQFWTVGDLQLLVKVRNQDL